MTYLIAGIIVFFGMHLVSATPLKRSLQAGLGENGYKGVYSLVSLAGLGLIGYGYSLTRSGPDAVNFLYASPEWARHATMLLVLLGFIALAAAFHRGRLKLWLRNPMSVGIALWSAGHLLSNGKVASVWLFGAFLLYALFDIIRHPRGRMPPSYVAKPAHDIIAVVAGLILYAIFLFGFHPYVLNLPVVT